MSHYTKDHQIQIIIDKVLDEDNDEDKNDNSDGLSSHDEEIGDDDLLTPTNHDTIFDNTLRFDPTPQYINI